MIFKIIKNLLIILLIFSFQSRVNADDIINADDISDFEIEGLSIGDSSLDYVDKEFIEKFMTKSGQTILKPALAEEIFSKEDFVK